MFFIVAIVIIYVQSFVDQTSQPELLIRAVLWVWVAVNYPIALALLINWLMLTAEPQHQLKSELHRQLAVVDAHLTYAVDGGPAPAPIALSDVQQGALTLQKLLKFSAMRDARYRDTQVAQLTAIAVVTRLHRAAGQLPAPQQHLSTVQLVALKTVRADCRALDIALLAGEPWRVARPVALDNNELPEALAEMQWTLHGFDDFCAHGNVAGKPIVEAPMIAPDAFTNPAYARFSLKTLLAVLISYVFYNATDCSAARELRVTR